MKIEISEMNIDKHFESVTQELKALKNRVRNYIDDRHWPTDGEWKESVLRTILRRHLPRTIGVGRGFVITDEKPSTQIDIIIYDLSKPILYHDGDLVFLTSDSVMGVIEVKTRITKKNLVASLKELSNNAELINHSGTWLAKRFFGLFSYESDLTVNEIQYTLEKIQKTVKGKDSRLIAYVALGESIFIRYWELLPPLENKLHYAWHAYHLENKAPGYFINNIIEHICPNSVLINQNIWYPKLDKEKNKKGELFLKSGKKC